MKKDWAWALGLIRGKDVTLFELSEDFMTWARGVDQPLPFSVPVPDPDDWVVARAQGLLDGLGLRSRLYLTAELDLVIEIW